MTEVENGFKIVNVDNSQLEKLRSSINAFDCGAEKVLESLELFIDDLEAMYYYDSSVPYENMFNALKCVVKSAQESVNIRNAIMTGIIQEVPSEKKVETRVKEPAVKKVSQKKTLDVGEVREYARGKTVSEIAEHFGVPVQYIKNFVSWHKIEYELGKAGRKALYNEEDVRKLAESMSVSEIAKVYMVSPDRIRKFIKRHGICCRKSGILI